MEAVQRRTPNFVLHRHRRDLKCWRYMNNSNGRPWGKEQRLLASACSTASSTPKPTSDVRHINRFKPELEEDTTNKSTESRTVPITGNDISSKNNPGLESSLQETVHVPSNDTFTARLSAQLYPPPPQHFLIISPEQL